MRQDPYLFLGGRVDVERIRHVGDPDAGRQMSSSALGAMSGELIISTAVVGVVG
jgi:hypothetical protein